MATNLKQRIRNGEHVYGVSVSMTTPRDALAARIEAGGYDFVAVDSQHSAFSEERLSVSRNANDEGRQEFHMPPRNPKTTLSFSTT